MYHFRSRDQPGIAGHVGMLDHRRLFVRKRAHRLEDRVALRPFEPCEDRPAGRVSSARRGRPIGAIVTYHGSSIAGEA